MSLINECEVHCNSCNTKILDIAVVCSNNNRITDGKNPIFASYHFKCPICKTLNITKVFAGSLIYDGGENFNVLVSDIEQFRDDSYYIELEIFKK